jgi:dienelactone hydrolase
MMISLPTRFALVATALLAACNPAAEAFEASQPSAAQAQGIGAGVAEPDEAATNYPPGTTRIELRVSDKRTVPVQLWYPAVDSARAAASAGRAVVEFEPQGSPHRETLERITREAPDTYKLRTMHAADSPPVRAQPQAFPLVLISHCTDCVRFAYFGLAEHLASKGYVVASPDHVDNTIYDYIAGTSVGLEINDFLEQRRLDIYAVTDLLLDSQSQLVPQGIRGQIDPDRIGMVGHSFGALTTGYASTRDPRIKAIASLAMLFSLENNLPYTGPELAQRVELQPLSKPELLISANEDTLQIVGLADIMRTNFLDATAESWFASIADTGHYSMMDLCGIMDAYTSGCGRGIRATRFLQPFEYLDVALATRLTREMVGRFFDRMLLGHTSADPQSVAFEAPNVLTVEHRTP